MLFSIVTKIENPRNREDLKKCVDSIMHYHPNEQIVIVDSDSNDKSYIEEYNKIHNVRVEDIQNKGYEAGAMWHVYNNYPSDTYVFLQDSMVLNRNLDEFRDSNLKVIKLYENWWGSLPEDREFAKEELKKTNYQYREENFSMVQFNSFLIKRTVLVTLQENGLDKVIPYNKFGSCSMERIMGIVLTDMGLTSPESILPPNTISKKWRNRK